MIWMMCPQTATKEQVCCEQWPTMLLPTSTHMCVQSHHTDNTWHHVAAAKQLMSPEGLIAPAEDPQAHQQPLHSASSHDSLLTSAVGQVDDLHMSASYQHAAMDGQMQDDLLLDNLHSFVAGGASVFSDSYLGSALYEICTPTSKKQKAFGGLYNAEGGAAARSLAVDADVVVGKPVWDCVQGIPVPADA